MNPVRVIERVRDGEPLPEGSLENFLEGYLSGAVEEYQVAAFLMAVVLRGLSEPDLARLVGVMLHSGATLDLSRLPGPRVDKHSTGGVGDKVSLPLAPLVAEGGVFVPMMAGRGLGHTGGTLDKLESIPGLRTDLDPEGFVGVLEATGVAIVGQSASMAPLDRKLYALRSVTGTVPSIPLIAASIMSKKLAEGIDGLVLDVKCGGGAFLPDEERALELARTLVGIGVDHGVETTALLTAMDRPLGRTVGNALELREAVDCLRGNGPNDLRELVIALAGEMFLVAGVTASAEAGRDRAAELLAGGGPLERFGRMVTAQGGDARILDDLARLPSARVVRTVHAREGGRIRAIDPLVLGRGVVTLGGGRTRLGEAIDRSVGFDLALAVGDDVSVGSDLGHVHARSEEDADLGETMLREAIRIGARDVQPVLRPLLTHRVTSRGVETIG